MNRLAVLLGLFFAPVLVVAAEPTRMEWTVGDLKREALVSVPESAKASEVPLVYVWHGHGGTMKHAAATMPFHKLWPEAIVVYAQGVPTPGKLTDPEGKKTGWQMGAGDHGDRDLKFFDEMQKSLHNDYKIDDKRIFSTGHSNGGGFTYLLWAARGEAFAAFAPSAAGPGSLKGARDLKPKPCLHVAGEADPLVKYENQKRTMEFVRKLNGCDAEGKFWDKGGPLVGTLYESKTGTPFLSLIHPGDHTYPSDAPKLIAKFFKEAHVGESLVTPRGPSAMAAFAARTTLRNHFFPFTAFSFDQHFSQFGTATMVP